jgi:hypothetical protein
MPKIETPQDATHALLACRSCRRKFVLALALIGRPPVVDRVAPCEHSTCRMGNIVRESAEAYVVDGERVEIVDAQTGKSAGVVESIKEALALLTEIALRWNGTTNGTPVATDDGAGVP